MATRGIPVGHLQHLVAQAGFPDDQKQELLKSLTKADAGVQNKVLQALDKIAPGTRANVVGTWAQYNGRAVHLFFPHVLEDRAPPALKRKVETRVGKSINWDEAVDIPKRKPLPPSGARMKWVRISKTEMEAAVVLRKHKTIAGDDGDVNVVVPVEVRLRVDLGHKDRMTFVFGALYDSRDALQAFVEWLLQKQLPADKQELEKEIEPIKFVESHARSLCRKLGLWQTGMHGADASGANGEMMVRAKKNGAIRGPVNLTKSVQAQDAAENFMREFGYTYPHPDGFPESYEVSFYFRASQPHVTFKTRTSTAAMRHLLDELAKEVR